MTRIKLPTKKDRARYNFKQFDEVRVVTTTSSLNNKFGCIVQEVKEIRIPFVEKTKFVLYKLKDVDGKTEWVNEMYVVEYNNVKNNIDNKILK